MNTIWSAKLLVKMSQTDRGFWLSVQMAANRIQVLGSASALGNTVSSVSPHMFRDKIIHKVGLKSKGSKLVSNLTTRYKELLKFGERISIQMHIRIPNAHES